MILQSQFRGWAYLNLVRMNFWLQRKAASKALNLKQRCCSLLDAEIRCLQPDLLQLGEDDRLDLVVEYVARLLTGREVLPELEPVLEDNRVAELLGAARKSKNILTVVARYHATDAFFACLLKDEQRKTKEAALARAAVAEIAEYDTGAIYREYKQTVTRLAKLRKELAERSALKMEFSIEGIAGCIAIGTALFFVAGFLYVNYFYRRMGVDVALYFSASDYLAASVEQIRVGAFAAANALVVFAVGVRTASLRSRLQARAMAATRRREGWFVAFFAVVLCGSIAYSIHIGKPEFSQIRLAGLVLSYWIADYVAVAYFKNHLVAMTALTAMMIFGLNVGVSSYERSELVLAGKDAATVEQRVHYKDSAPAVTGELFGANGSYYFIYARDRGITHVVPRDRVAQIDITKKPQ